MKKYLYGALAMTAGLYSGVSMAETTIYGIIDTGVEYVTHANAAGDSVVKMPTLTGSLPSRIGFKGTEDLGGGMQALYVLETGLSPDVGAVGQGNRLFGRQAFVGLKGAYGTLSLGRQANMTLVSMFKADVMGPNIHGMSNMDGYLPNARSDNAIGYMGKFDAFSVGATYSFGRDASAAGGPAATNCGGEVAGNSKACSQFTGLLAYDTKAFGVAAAYDKLYGNAGAAGGLTNSSYYVERTSLNGYAMLGNTKFGGGLIKRKTHAATDNTADLYYAGVSYPFAKAWMLDAQVARLDVKNSPDASTLLSARVTYNLSKRTAVYTSFGHINNDGAAAIAVSAGSSVAAGVDQSGMMVGVRHFF
ncbi:porin [Noviherbaspirillum sp.]|uniref:porin n=1 Tax=Noviherbaspirillum sp. TaxID=1926288 RepID=UPI002B476792|nr:porin [Noviherbaspirillum sp.]HJV81570.1 porin [Noviherbaspirillum sp.]